MAIEKDEVMDPSWPAYFEPKVVREGFGGGRLSTFTIALEAWRRDLTVTLHDQALNRFEISDGSTAITFNHACPVSITPLTARQQLRDKWESKKLLQESGVPVPRGLLVDAASTGMDDLSEIAETIGYPVTIKPVAGSKGQGVHTEISSWEELESVYAHLTESNVVDQLLIEQNVPGDDYRLLVLGDKVLAACKRVPANVEGDGSSSIDELITEKNKKRRRNPFLSTGLIRPNYEMNATLRSQGYTLTSIPEKGAYVELRRIANASAGGDVIDVTDSIPAELKQAAVDAVAAVSGIVIAGVDVLYQPAGGSNSPKFSVIEMNYRPHIGVNMYPTSGRGRDIPGELIDFFFPDSPRCNKRDADEKTVAFNFALMKKEWKVGEHRQIPPAPAHRCVFRLVARMAASDVGLTTDAAYRIAELCGTLDVSGHLRRVGDEYRMVAGGEEDSVRKAIDRVSELVHATSVRTSHWRGRMQTGFHVKGIPEPISKRTFTSNVAYSKQQTRISLVGDVLLHSNLLGLGADNDQDFYAEQFEPIAADISKAGIASANLESIAAGQAYGLSGFPSFNAPEEILDGLKGAGFGVLNVANNHMLDKGEEALLASLANIQKRGLVATGAVPDQGGLVAGAVVEEAGIRVGFVSFTDESKLNIRGNARSRINVFPGESQSIKMVRRVKTIRTRLKELRAQSDVVVLQLHFGEEYHKEPSSFQRELIASLCEFEVDVIVGHHPHVLQPIEWVENSKGRHVLVAYSLGNFFSGQSGVHRQMGGVFSFSIERVKESSFAEYRILEPELLLTYVDHGDRYRVKRMSDYVSHNPRIDIAGQGERSTSAIYNESIKRLSSRDSGINIL